VSAIYKEKVIAFCFGSRTYPVLLLQDRYNLQGKGGTVLRYPLKTSAAIPIVGQLPFCSVSLTLPLCLVGGVDCLRR